MDDRENKHSDGADVVDISPLTCGACGQQVELEDAYCGSCGADLLETKPILCATCGRAVPRGRDFCTNCGTALRAGGVGIVDPYTEPIISAPPPPPSPQREITAPIVAIKRRRRPAWVWIPASVLVLAVLAAAGWFLFLKPPGLADFDAVARDSITLIGDIQAETDDLDDPSGLDRLSQSMDGLSAEITALQRRAAAVEEVAYQQQLEAVLSGASDYVEELGRLAELPSAEVSDAQSERAPELAAIVIRETEGLDPLRPEANLKAPELSPTNLITVLSDLRAYREEILRERVAITKENRRRARELSGVRAATAGMDGILARYADARGELAQWTDKVDSGSYTSFAEAYDVLAQHADLREQLRTELSSITVPDPFGTDKSSFLAVMDTAVNAMRDAARGIAEYQFDPFYFSYDETPGWVAFESATDDITANFSAALSTYEARKAEVTAKLSKKTPLPELPE